VLHYTLGLLVVVGALAGTGTQGTAQSPSDLMPSPDVFTGWTPGEGRRVSDAGGLYDYMNGGAEVYIDYGFEDLAVGEWTSPEGDPLKVEVYRLRAPKSAYGLYTQDTWGEEIDVGQGGRVQGGTLRFWKGEYFVRVFMWRGYQDHGAVILGAGRSVAERIGTRGAVPRMVSCLPQKGLADGGLHFFHTALTLGTFYYLSEGNPLGLSGETDGVIGEYELEDGNLAFLVLVAYPDRERAARAFDDLVGLEKAKGQVTEPRAADVAFGQDDGLWRMISVWPPFVILALDGPTREVCREFVDRVRANLEAGCRMEAKTDSCGQTMD